MQKIQNPILVFTEIERKNYKMYMKPHNIPNNQNNPEQNFQRDDHSKLQNILQSLSNKNIMVMGQNRHVDQQRKQI